ncbi:hypothetical protein GOV11_01950 [Candidatus Woesearchaeota archaeon]|nr:hypothetical protein [Candidatus Woesearchaeota archaeon]
MRCVLCEEPITNPICPGCLREGVRQWLWEERREELVPAVEELTRGIFRNMGDIHCIKCNSLMSVCTYCYTEEVFRLIRHYPELVAQYLEFFNYDLGHQGWAKEARERLGGNKYGFYA